MEENDDILLFDELEEIEDPQGPLWNINPFYPLPEWAECPDGSLELGSDYVYFVSGLIYYRCHVLFNDGMSAILRRSEYVCLDIETEQSYFCRYEDDDDIQCYLEEEEGELAPYSVDPADFREWRESTKNAQPTNK